MHLRSWTSPALVLALTAAFLNPFTEATGELALVEPGPSRFSDLPFTATMVSERGEWVGGSGAITFDQSNAKLILSQSSDGIFVELLVGEGDRQWWPRFFFAPDPSTDEPLGVGYYGEAHRYPSSDPGHPGMEVGGTGNGCNESEGHFEVRQLHRTDGYIDRLHLLFEQHCGYEVNPALFGEVRIGLPQRSFTTAPTAISWPEGTQSGTRARVVPINVHAEPDNPTRVERITLAGSNPGQFHLITQDCVGARVHLKGCEAQVTYAPKRAGPATAVVRIKTTRGLRRVRLDATGSVGVTKWTLRSDPGDFVGGGKDRVFTHGPDRIAFPNDGQDLYSYVFDRTGSTWTADFGAPAGNELTVGHYSGATRHGFHGDNPGMAVFGQSRGCNELTGSFTVSDLARSDSGDYEFLDLTFVQFCGDSDAALRGRLQLNAGPDHKPPRAVDSLRTLREDGQFRVRWRNPSNRDFAAVMIRMFAAPDAAAGAPRTGSFVYAGQAQRVTINDPRPGRPITITAYAYDRAGNVSIATVRTN